MSETQTMIPAFRACTNDSSEPTYQCPDFAHTRWNLAERGGFEPPVELLTLRRFSKPLLSTTQPPLREGGRVAQRDGTTSPPGTEAWRLGNATGLTEPLQTKRP